MAGDKTNIISPSGFAALRAEYDLLFADEADAGAGRIGWNSPLARALRGAATGDLRTVQLPAGPKEWEIVAIAYP